MRSARKRLLTGAMLIVCLGLSIPIASATSNRVEADIKTLTVSLMVFEGAHGFLPTKEEGLHALVSNPDPAKFRNWQKLVDQVPLDPWGHGYQYIPPAPEGIRDYGIFSFGKDGISISNGNDPDDFNSWNPDRQQPRQSNSLAYIAIVACVLVPLSWHLVRRVTRNGNMRGARESG